MKELAWVLGMDKTRTTPYHPQADGQVERFNRTLAAMLVAVVAPDQSDWDVHFPYGSLQGEASSGNRTQSKLHDVWTRDDATSGRHVWCPAEGGGGALRAVPQEVRRKLRLAFAEAPQGDAPPGCI